MQNTKAGICSYVMTSPEISNRPEVYVYLPSAIPRDDLPPPEIVTALRRIPEGLFLPDEELEDKNGVPYTLGSLVTAKFLETLDGQVSPYVQSRKGLVQYRKNFEVPTPQGPDRPVLLRSTWILSRISGSPKVPQGIPADADCSPGDQCYGGSLRHEFLLPKALRPALNAKLGELVVRVDLWEGYSFNDSNVATGRTYIPFDREGNPQSALDRSQIDNVEAQVNAYIAGKPIQFPRLEELYNFRRPGENERRPNELTADELGGRWPTAA